MKKKLLAGIMAASLAILTMASCSSNTSSDSSAASGGKTKIRLQLKWLPSAQFMGFFVAKDKGYYEKEGLDVTFINGGPDIVSQNQVSVGAADFGVANLYNILPFEEQGYPIIQVGQVFQESSLVLISKKSSNINSAKDLKGKKIGAWVGTADYPIHALLDKYNIADSAVSIVNQGNTIDNFLNGSLDVASATVYNEYLLAQESGISADDMNVIDLDAEGCGMLEDGLIVNTDWLNKNKDAAAKFVKATMEGWADACKDPEGAVDISWNYTDQSSTTKEHQVKAAKAVAKLVAPNGTDYKNILQMGTDKFNTTEKIAVKYGIIKKVPDKVYDNSLRETALKELR